MTGIVCEQVSVFGTKVADPSEFAILSITAVQNVLVCFEMSAPSFIRRLALWIVS